MTDVFMKRRYLVTEICTEDNDVKIQEEHYVKMMMAIYKPTSLKVLRKNQICQVLDLRFLASKTETINFCCLSQPVCGTLLWQPWEINTYGLGTLLCVMNT